MTNKRQTGVGLLAAKLLRRSVRRENGPPDHFLISASPRAETRVLRIESLLPSAPYAKKIAIGDLFAYGADGSRTRVRNPIPCTSTSVVCCLTFPLPGESKHPPGFSSFMIRPHTQSFVCVVSYVVDARLLTHRYARADSCH